MAGLKAYRAKRSFSATPEPRGTKEKGKSHRFVVHKHAARHLHYDLRLELDGTLKSWAVPKGPPHELHEKHLAIMVEDHPLAYRTFKGRIPAGQYGAGTVEIWDHGTYETGENLSSTEIERKMKRDLADGKLKIRFHGKKLHETFALVRMNNPKIKNGWLLMKESDKPASPIVDTVRMPHRLKPMLAQVGEAAFDRAGWLFETKWDGYRALAEINKGKVDLYSRNGQSFNKKMPSLVDELSQLPVQAIIDGEVIAIGKTRRPQFQVLQDYFKQGNATLVYRVFDLLYLDGHDIRNLPLRERKKLLKRLVEGMKHVKYSDHTETKGKTFFKKTIREGTEGMMAKRADSPYLTGQRTSDWLKIKEHARQEAIIVGYTEPRGTRKYLGALILAVYSQGELRYIGHTGGGSSDEMLKDLKTRLKKLETKESPFAQTPKTNAPAHWVKPQLVAEVKFQEWTNEGIMRQPVLLGLRIDKKASQVVKEEPMPEGISHVDKIFWPKDKITKGDLAKYYDTISPYLLPHLANRPLVMHRFPDGINGEAFFQKDNPHVPKGIRTISIHHESENKTLKYIVCNDKKTLRYVVQLGTIVLHPWFSKNRRLGRPEFMVIDLDPEAISFDKVVQTALVVKQVLDELGATNYCKTSGSRGLHVCVPLGGKYSYEQSLLFAQLVASIVHERLPKITSLDRSPDKRQHKVYLDCLQNRRGQTLVAPYSVRPNPGATVSTPLEWKEVKKGLDPKKFTINTVPTRVRRLGDLWKPLLGKGIDLKRCLKRAAAVQIKNHR